MIVGGFMTDYRYEKQPIALKNQKKKQMEIRFPFRAWYSISENFKEY